MRYIGYKFFSLLFGIVGLLATILSVVIIYNPSVLDFLHIDVTALLDNLPYVMLGSSMMAIVNIIAFLLVVINQARGKLRRSHFAIGLLGSLIALGTIVGIIYTIIAFKTIFTAEVDEYQDDEANITLIRTPIILGVIGIPLVILPSVLTFPPELMSISMCLGILFLSLFTSLLTYLFLGPKSHIHPFLKFLILIAILGILVGLYFIFALILEGDASRYGGDWPTIQRDIISMISTAGLLNIMYFIYGLVGKDYVAYIYSFELSFAVALLAMILANWLAFYWLILIELILDAIGLSFILFLIGGLSLSAGGSSHTYSLIDDRGKEHTLTYEGNGHYKDEDGNRYTSDDGGTTAYRDDR